MQKNPRELVDILRNGGHDAFQGAWRHFFFNVVEVRAITEVIEESQKAEVLQAGSAWTGGGWNSSSAGKRLFEVTGVPILATNIKQYRDAFLYSLALLWEIDIPDVSLPDRAAEAAFALSQAYTDMDVDLAEHAEEQHMTDQGLPWDEEVHELPSALKVVWARCVSGDKRIDLKTLLDEIPVWDTLPRKPPSNNYRGHAAYKN
jgi:hypothetical protein